MSRSVSAPSSVTNTSPCWNGFIVPGSTFRYGSSFCMLTRRPRSLSSRPRLEAVSPLPRLDATPPVTKRCRVETGRDACSAAKPSSRGRYEAVNFRRSTDPQDIRPRRVGPGIDVASPPGEPRCPPARPRSDGGRGVRIGSGLELVWRLRPRPALGRLAESGQLDRADDGERE